jgi:hypothetical protein
LEIKVKTLQPLGWPAYIAIGALTSIIQQSPNEILFMLWLWFGCFSQNLLTLPQRRHARHNLNVKDVERTLIETIYKSILTIMLRG